MALTRRAIETLIDLAENKLSQMEIYDREDLREASLLKACIVELNALKSGAGGMLAEPARRAPGRPRLRAVAG